MSEARKLLKLLPVETEHGTLHKNSAKKILLKTFEEIPNKDRTMLLFFAIAIEGLQDDAVLEEKHKKLLQTSVWSYIEDFQSQNMFIQNTLAKNAAFSIAGWINSLQKNNP